MTDSSQQTTLTTEELTYRAGDPIWAMSLCGNAPGWSAGEILGPATDARWDYCIVLYEHPSSHPNGAWHAHAHQLKPRANGSLSQLWTAPTEVRA